MVAIMGTSTCHVMNSDRAGRGARACAASSTAASSPGLWGYEAGQSGVGDIFGWFVDNGVPAAYDEAPRARGLGVHEYLTELAAAQEVGEHGLVALDWHSGNRSVLVDHELSGVDRRPDPGDPARGHLPRAAGGHRLRHPHDHRGVREQPASRSRSSSSPAGCSRTRFLMQIYADVTRRPLSVIGSDAGAGARFGDLRRGRRRGLRRRARGRRRRWARCSAPSTCPTSERAAAYDALFAEYRRLHDHFGRGGNDVAAPAAGDAPGGRGTADGAGTARRCRR